MEGFNIKPYVPELLSPVISCKATVELILASHKIIEDRQKRLAKAYDVCFNEYWYGYVRKVRSNNWLKMHGYPMRRRGV